MYKLTILELLQHSIASPVTKTNPSTTKFADSHNDFLSEIKEGFALKPLSKERNDSKAMKTESPNILDQLREKMKQRELVTRGESIEVLNEWSDDEDF